MHPTLNKSTLKSYLAFLFHALSTSGAENPAVPHVGYYSS